MCWWRRRESNPRPKILYLRFYMFSSEFKFRPAEPLGTGSQWRYPAKFHPLVGRRTQGVIPLIDALIWPRGKDQEDGRAGY